MARLSVTVITYNEAENIGACLESVAWADEIIVVDSHSSDDTVRIARRFTDTVIQRPWPGHVRQKQFALEQATGDWVLSLDADERLSAEAGREIRQQVLERDTPAAAAYSFPRLSWYLGRWIRHGGWYPDRKVRLVRRGAAHWGGQDPHDKLLVEGPVSALKGHILHYVYRDLSHQLQTVNSFSHISALQWHRQGRRLALPLMLVRPPIRFLEMYVWKGGALDGVPGFIIAVVSSYYVFLKYAKLWERVRASAPDPGPNDV